MRGRKKTKGQKDTLDQIWRENYRAFRNSQERAKEEKKPADKK